MKNMVNKGNIKRSPVKELLKLIKDLDKRKLINTLSILQSGINDSSNYTHVSFKIPTKY